MDDAKIIKITDLTAYTDPASTDVLPIVDVANDTTKKVSVGEIVGKITGDVDVAADGTSSIATGVIVDADVSANAEIAVSKLANGAARQLLQTDAAGTGVEWTDNVDIPGTLDVTGTTTLDDRLLVGTSTGVPTGALQAKVQVFSSTQSESISSHLGFNGGAVASPVFTLSRSRSTTYGSYTIVQNGDLLGRITFVGDDGVDYNSIAAQISAEVDGTPGAGDMPGRLVFSTTADGASSPTERMRITKGGEICVGTTTARNTATGYGNLTVFGSDYAGVAVTNNTNGSFYLIDRIKFDTSSFYVLNSSSVGVRLDSGATSWASQSDERFKANLTEIADGLNKVGTLRAVTGRYLSDSDDVSRSFLIAQDVQSVLPEAVSEENDEHKTLGIRYTEVIPLLVAALKESKERIETLEAEVASLKAS